LANDGTIQTVVRQNLIQNNNQPGAGSGAGIRTDFALNNALIDANTFTGQSDAGIGFISTQTGIIISNNIFDGNGRALFAFT